MTAPALSRHPLASLSVRDRLRSVLDERRWRDYARSPTAIFYRAQERIVGDWPR